MQAWRSSPITFRKVHNILDEFWAAARYREDIGDAYESMYYGSAWGSVSLTRFLTYNLHRFLFKLISSQGTTDLPSIQFEKRDAEDHDEGDQQNAGRGI